MRSVASNQPACVNSPRQTLLQGADGGASAAERGTTLGQRACQHVELLGVLTPPPNRALECHQLLSPLSFGRKEGGREGEGFTDG
jgi:hypothetical protein